MNAQPGAMTQSDAPAPAQGFDPATWPGIARELKRAVAQIRSGREARTELQLYYQPRVCAMFGKVVRAEALLRWEHPKLGVIPPDIFIPMLRRHGDMGIVGNWVLAQAIAAASRWARLADAPKIAVNVEPAQLEAMSFPGQVLDLLRRHGVAPNRLELEVTESCVFQDASSASQVLDDLRRSGIDIAMDDFGSGMEALMTIAWLPANVIKIERRLCNQMETDHRTQQTMRAVVAFARTLGLRVVMEGIETEQQMRVAQRTGFDELQGFHFSRAVREEEFVAIARERRSWIAQPAARPDNVVHLPPGVAASAAD